MEQPENQMIEAQKRARAEALRKIGELCQKFGLAPVDLSAYFVSPRSSTIISQVFAPEEDLLIFDVGAHFGESAMRYARSFPRSTIFSFEPFPQSYEQLSKIGSDRIRTFDFGLSDTSGTELFSVNLGSPTNSLLQLNDSAKETWNGNEWLTKKGTVECRFDTLDNVISELGIDEIDFLKIDVQGAEFKVLDGARKALENRKIKLIQMELIIADIYQGQQPISYYFQYFEKFGYEVHSFADFVTSKEGRLLQMDVFFKVK